MALESRGVVVYFSDVQFGQVPEVIRCEHSVDKAVALLTRHVVLALVVGIETWPRRDSKCLGFISAKYVGRWQMIAAPRVWPRVVCAGREEDLRSC
jgi:hypothetical protein